MLKVGDKVIRIIRLKSGPTLDMEDTGTVIAGPLNRVEYWGRSGNVYVDELGWSVQFTHGRYDSIADADLLLAE